MTEKDFLREQLQLLTKAHYDAVQPIIRRLAAIEAITVKPLHIWSTQDGLQHFEEGLKGPKTESVLEKRAREFVEGIELSVLGPRESCDALRVRAAAVRPTCSCFPGTCREQVDKDGVTVSGNRCRAFVPATIKPAAPRMCACACAPGVVTKCVGEPNSDGVCADGTTCKAGWGYTRFTTS
jgi:hypothetical protein